MMWSQEAKPPREVGTLNPLPPGAVVRTDDEPGEKKEISDDLRLNFAKALLPKIESSDPATAERLTNAAQAMLGPMVRADDDADAKNRATGQGPVKKGSRPGAATAKDDDEGEGEPDKDKEKARKAPDDNEEEGTHPIDIMHSSNFFLGPLQGLVSAAVAALFFTSTKE